MQAIRHSHRDHKAAPTPADDVIPVTPEDLNHYTNPTTRITDAWTYRASSIATRMSMNTDSARTRHCALTHDAEAGASTPMLMAKSGHTSVASLAR